MQALTRALVALGLLTLSVRAEEGVAEDDRLFGWKGETYHGEQGAASTPGRNVSARWIETVSWMPRAFVFHGFLSDEECEHLKTLALKGLSRSMVVGQGGEAIDPIRTSYSASITPYGDDIVKRIEDKIAAWTHLPHTYGEPIEVLRYKNGQKYDAHWDWFEEKEVGREGNRVATVLMYLSDVEDAAGGETALPLASPLDERLQSLDNKGYSECASHMGISVRPKKGDTLLFWDMHPDGKNVDRHALHASCPTYKGEKWTATKWIHGRPYG